MQPNLQAFAMELSKLAYGLKDAEKVLSLAKKRQLPKASAKVWLEKLLGDTPPPKFHGIGIGVIPSRKMINEDIAHAMKTAPESLKETVREGAEAARATNASMQRGGRRQIVPGRGDIIKSTKAFVGEDAPKTFIPAENKKMLQSIIKGHELDELAVKPSLALRGAGHRNPDVILREHNRIATLPKDHEAVRKYMIELRGPVEGNAFSAATGGGFVYGESPRISRHARKRISELLDNKTKKLMEEMEG